MTPEEINIAVARLTGHIVINGNWTVEEIIACGAYNEVPNFYGALNAIIPIIRTIKYEIQPYYLSILKQILLTDNGVSEFDIHTAPPDKICMAFLFLTGAVPCPFAWSQKHVNSAHNVIKKSGWRE